MTDFGMKIMGGNYGLAEITITKTVTIAPLHDKEDLEKFQKLVKEIYK